ncbi:MAG TPA: preprotein translocase subunit SecE [Actinomycetes bacterium]|nr:preprotein translocase subunit SecE [Actinomycetes bacterium]
MTDTRDTRAPRQQAEVAERGPGPLARLGLFYRQIVTELRKVVWPTRAQLLTYTAVVTVFVTVMIAYVSGLDYGIGWVMLRIFG